MAAERPRITPPGNYPNKTAFTEFKKKKETPAVTPYDPTAPMVPYKPANITPYDPTAPMVPYKISEIMHGFDQKHLPTVTPAGIYTTTKPNTMLQPQTA